MDAAGRLPSLCLARLLMVWPRETHRWRFLWYCVTTSFLSIKARASYIVWWGYSSSGTSYGTLWTFGFALLIQTSNRALVHQLAFYIQIQLVEDSLGHLEWPSKRDNWFSLHSTWYYGANLPQGQFCQCVLQHLDKPDQVTWFHIHSENYCGMSPVIFYFLHLRTQSRGSQTEVRVPRGERERVSRGQVCDWSKLKV